jgi:hypothetical protein
MAKTKLWFAVLLCVVGFLALSSCAKTRNTLRIESAESGLYKVDVAEWVYLFNKIDSYWFYDKRFTDADVKIDAYYAQPGSGMPTIPGSAARLMDYTITWSSQDPANKIPKLTGSMDVQVPGTPDGKTKVTTTILVIPSVTKETCGAITARVADPENLVFYNGEFTARGTITVNGKDQITDEALSATCGIEAVFQDYVDPNKFH